MTDQTIITPYFLDEHLPALEALGRPGMLNMPKLPDGKVESRLSILHEGLAGLVERSVRSDQRPVSIAGDCCTTIGMMAGLTRAGVEPALIWLDAHGDFNTWETTPSGFLGGMPLAMLVGRGDQNLMKAVRLSPLEEGCVLLTDARDLDPGEAAALRQSGVHRLVDLADLDSVGLPKGQLYVHFDVDILNPEVLPAVSYPAAGGPGVDQIAYTFDILARSGRVAAVSMSAWNPDLDPNGDSQEICMDLLDRLTGQKN